MTAAHQDAVNLGFTPGADALHFCIPRARYRALFCVAPSVLRKRNEVPAAQTLALSRGLVPVEASSHPL